MGRVASAQVRLNPQVAEWKRIHDTQGWRAFLQRVKQDLFPPEKERGLTMVRGGTSAATWVDSAPPPAGRVNDEFWARLSQLREPHPSARRGAGGGGGGGGDSVTFGPASFRGTHLFAPYASEWLGSFTVEPPNTTGYNSFNPIPNRADSLRAFEVHAAFLARQGVNVVRVLFPYGAYKWWTLSGGGSGATNYAAYLQDVIAALDRHGIRVIVALGNSFGEDPIQVDGNPLAWQRFWKRASPDNANIPQVLDQNQQPVDSRYLTYDEAPWGHTAYFQEPSNWAIIDADTDSTFLKDEFYPYITWLANNLKVKTNIIAWELFNEPDGIPFDKVAPAIEGILSAVAAADTSGTRAFVLGARTPFTLTLLDSYFSVQPDWIASNIQWVGFHVQTVPFYRGGRYEITGTSPKDGDPGFPPKPFVNTELFGLLQTAGPAPTSGALDAVYDFMDAFGVQGFIEEACLRGPFTQLFHDLDIAARDGGPLGEQKLGVMYWTSAYSSFAPYLMSANGGGDFIPREALSMQDRNRVGSEVSSENHVDTTRFVPVDNATSGSADSRVFRVPTASNTPSEPGSRALRPLILTGGNGPTTLLVGADPFEDLPTVTHYQDTALDPANSARPNARNRIWIRAFRPTARSAVLDLQGLASGNPAELCRLSWDLRFKEVANDHLISGENPSALRFRKSFLDIGTIGAWTGAMANVSGTPTLYPQGPISIDPVWSVVSGGVLKTPTVDLPTGSGCSANWTDYIVDLGSLEFELTMRGHFHHRSRLSYAGVSGQLAGVALNPTTVDRFLIAYHRAVPSTLQSEHYGAGQDATDTSDTSLKLRGGARYGDLFRKTTSQGNSVHEKYEIVLVEIGVSYTSGSFSFAVTPTVLPTLGDHDCNYNSSTVEGASALDPMLARNQAGDVAILYRKVQDPYFRFDQATDGTLAGVTIDPAAGFDGKGTCDPTLPSSSWPTMLPVSSASSPKLKYTTTWQQSAMNFYPGVVAVRFRGASASSFGAETVVSEPYVQSGSAINAEDWQAFQDRCKNLREYDKDNYFFLQDGTSPWAKWVTDRVYGGTNGLLASEINANDPEAWHPAFPAALQLGPRIPPDGVEEDPSKLKVMVAWKQMPRHRRKVTPWYVTSPLDAPREKSAYAVYALNLTADLNNNAFDAVPSAFERFQSQVGMVGTSSDPSLEHDPLLTTWDLPAVTFDYKSSTGNGTAAENDTGDLRATWQQRWQLHNQKASASTGSGRPTAVDQPASASDKGILYGPKSGYEPRGGLFSPDSTLRLTAWCHPNGTATELRYEWDKAVVSQSSGSTPLTMPGETGTFSSTALTRIVDVVPWVRNLTSGIPVGRVVWQAEDDIWVAEIPYDTGSGNAPKVARVTPSGQRSGTKGKFPVLLTEVSVQADLIAWTYEGKLHAVRMAAFSFP